MNQNLTIKDETVTFKVTLKVACTTALTLGTLNVVDTVYHINTNGATTTLLDVPTYTQTPASCTDPQTLTIHPTSNLAGAAPGYLTIVTVGGALKVKIESGTAADAATETSYTIKATSPTGTVTETTAVFKLTMTVPCTTALAVATDTI